MPNSEEVGPGPEEQEETSPEVAEASETEQVGEPTPPDQEVPTTQEEEAPAEKAEKPETKKGWRERLAERLARNREKRRTEKEQAEIRRNLARARERRIKGYAEIIKHGARSPQELAEMLADLSFKDLVEAQRRVKYGGGLVGKLKAYMAGELDFQINDDQAVQEYYRTLNELRLENNGAEPTKEQHAARMGISVEELEQIHLIEDADKLTELGRRLASTFVNRRTAVSAGAYLALGILTGGFGWAAGGVLIGGVAGRFTAEMGELFAGRTREARENVLYAEKARWERMQALALQIRASKEDAVTQGALTKELVDLMYRQGENVLVRNLAANEKELAKREEKFHRIRNRLQTVGEVVGGVAGLSSILNGGVEHLDMDFFNKIDGQTIFHGVQQTNAVDSGWQFLYSSGAEAGLANFQGATVLAGGQFGAHALEATTSQVIAYTVAERTLPILLASQLAAIDHRRTGKALFGANHEYISPDRYYTESGPNGGKVIYTREEDGTYKRWEWQEVEEKNGDKTKLTKRLVGTTVDEKDVPKKFVERLAETQNSRNAERLTNQMVEYIRRVADENHNPIPENPRGFSYDWDEQPKVIDNLDMSKLDFWYQFVKVNGKDEPRIDPETGRIVEVGVLGVDVINNRIAYVRFERTSNGTEHSPIEVMRLDQFLRNFHLHLDQKAGSPITEYLPDQNTDEYAGDEEGAKDEPESTERDDSEDDEKNDGEQEDKTDHAGADSDEASDDQGDQGEPLVETEKSSDDDKQAAGPEKPPRGGESLVDDVDAEISQAFSAGHQNERDKQADQTEKSKNKEKKKKNDWLGRLEKLAIELDRKFDRKTLKKAGIIVRVRLPGRIKGVNEEGYPTTSITIYKKSRKGSYAVETMRITYKDNGKRAAFYSHRDSENRWVDEEPNEGQIIKFINRVLSTHLPDPGKEKPKEKDPASNYDQEIPVPINKPKAELVEETPLPEGFIEARRLPLSEIEEGDVLLLEKTNDERSLRSFNTLENYVEREGKYLKVKIEKIKNRGVVNIKNRARIPYSVVYEAVIQPMVVGRRLRPGESEQPAQAEETQTAPDNDETIGSVIEAPSNDSIETEVHDYLQSVPPVSESEPVEPDQGAEEAEKEGIDQLLERAGKTLEDFRVGAKFKLKESVPPEYAGYVEDIIGYFYPDKGNRPNLDEIEFEVYEDPDPVPSLDDSEKPIDYLITFIGDDASGESKENFIPLSLLLNIIK